MSYNRLFLRSGAAVTALCKLVSILSVTNCPAAAYNVQLNVSPYFAPQVPPGSWKAPAGASVVTCANATCNCGQTSVLIVAGFYNGSTPTQQDIMAADDWLFSQYHDPVNSFNGSETDTTKLVALAQHYGFADSAHYSNWTIQSVQAELTAGHPVIVSVWTNMTIGKPNLRHFMVMTGMDDNYVYVNDPGHTLGNQLPYSRYKISQFQAAWSDQNSAVVVIHPSAPPPLPTTITIDFEHFPDANGLLTIPTPTNCQADICGPLNTQYAQLGVTLLGLLWYNSACTQAFFCNNHFSSSPGFSGAFSIPVYSVAVDSDSFWTATLTTYDSQGTILGTAVLDNSTPGNQSVLGTLRVSSPQPIARFTVGDTNPGHIFNIDNLVYSTTK